MQTTKQIKVPAFSMQGGPPAYQQAAPPPRRVPFGLVAFVLLLALGIGSAVVGWRVLSQLRAATPAATAQPSAPVDISVLLRSDAPRILLTPVPQPVPTHTPPRYSVRGGPLPGAQPVEPQPAPQRVEIYACKLPRSQTYELWPGVDPYRVEQYGPDTWLVIGEHPRTVTARACRLISNKEWTP